MSEKQTFGHIIPAEIATDNPAITVSEITPELEEAYTETATANQEHLAKGMLFHGPKQISEKLAEDPGSVRAILHDNQIAGGIIIGQGSKPKSVEIAYWTDKDHTKLGIGRSAVSAAVDILNQQGLTVEASVLKASHLPSNEGSRRLLRGLHFERTQNTMFMSKYERKKVPRTSADGEHPTAA